jgi:protein-S-isoprenylcysteine O-methyltransferase Ste14
VKDCEGLQGDRVIAKACFYGIVVCWWAFLLTFWLRKRPPSARKTQHDRGSYVGLLLQSAAYFVVLLPPLRYGRMPIYGMAGESGKNVSVLAMLALLIAVVSVGLVNWAARSLGKQWSLEARLVEGHDLIEDGPYRFVRNPIYTGMFGMLVATGLIGMQWERLAVAVVLFATGTYVRIRAEERLLRGAFGVRFEEYARRVWALIPGIY